MNLIKKVICLFFTLLCMQAYADELSTDLQKACVKEKLSQHKGTNGHAIEASYFNEYCKCETDYIVTRVTNEQLNKIYKEQTIKPNWLTRLKSNALKSCMAQGKQITT